MIIGVRVLWLVYLFLYTLVSSGICGALTVCQTRSSASELPARWGPTQRRAGFLRENALFFKKPVVT